MQFARLRLSGFKSFVDPTELLIEPGLTGVVGPNGCGKSNLLEAMQWVMGENRAKSLRGAGMDDVIFAGTDRRPPRNLAEVTLVLEAGGDLVPSFVQNSDTLEVTRRIERESGSAYRMNGHDVRQKDVQLLFADAATGAHSPALVSQGRIGSLINAKTRDRRMILEEAAGISGLHTRRKEAESRLRGAENNLVRLQDVVGQMEAQINSLKRQARQAKRYRNISTDIRQAEASVMYLKWRMASEEVVELERKLRAAQSGVGEVSSKVAILNKQQVDLASVLPGLREKAAEAAAIVQRLSIARENLEAEETRRKETALALTARLKQIELDSGREQEIAGDAKAGLGRLESEKARLLEATLAERDTEIEAREALDKAVKDAGEAEQAYDGLSQQAAGARARRESLESDLSALQRRIDVVISEQGRMAAKLQELGATDDVIGRQGDARKIVAETELLLAKCHEVVSAAEEATANARNSLSEAQTSLQESEGGVKALRSEVAGLQQMLTTQAGSAQPLTDQVRATAGYEEAVGAAFGDDIDASINEDDERYWRELKAVSGVVNWPNGVTALSDVADVPSVLENRIALIGYVKSDAEARNLQDQLKPGQKIVSKDGGVWRWDGFTRRAGARSKAAIRMEQRNRLEDLQKRLADSEAALDEAAKRAASAKQSHDEARSAEQTARSTRGETEQAMGAARRRLMEAEQESSRIASKADAIRETKARLESEEKDITARRAVIETEIADLPELHGLEADLSQARADVEALRTALGNARAKYDALRRESQARSDRKHAIETEANAWQLRVTSADKQLAELARRKTEAEQELKAVIAGPDKIDEKREALIAELDKAHASRSETGDSLAFAETTLAEKDKALREAQEIMASAREHQIRAEAAVETAQARRKDIASQVGERFECPPNKVLETVGIKDGDSLKDLATVESRHDRLKRERENLGAVNLRAEEELNEIDEQLSHLVSERKDLEGAIARLRQAISSLNKEGRERLLAAFKEVNDHFGDLFKTLFGGGEAHLELTESDDPLDAGLEIYASPPGKKLQTLSLLSGGEQALTALSLIFGVFMTNPAPICVLDEVDAPLDDANVERFCNLLDEMMERTKTRFLIVTHNAVSMARMHRLFGVTMAEQGVSTVVSVDLERAEEMVAAQ